MLSGKDLSGQTIFKILTLKLAGIEEPVRPGAKKAVDFQMLGVEERQI